MSERPSIPPEPGGEVFRFPSGLVRLIWCDTRLVWRAMTSAEGLDRILDVGADWHAAYLRASALDASMQRLCR